MPDEVTPQQALQRDNEGKLFQRKFFNCQDSIEEKQKYVGNKDAKTLFKTALALWMWMIDKGISFLMVDEPQRAYAISIDCASQSEKLVLNHTEISVQQSRTQ